MLNKAHQYLLSPSNMPSSIKFVSWVSLIENYWKILLFWLLNRLYVLFISFTLVVLESSLWNIENHETMSCLLEFSDFLNILEDSENKSKWRKWRLLKTISKIKWTSRRSWSRCISKRRRRGEGGGGRGRRKKTLKEIDEKT